MPAILLSEVHGEGAENSPRLRLIRCMGKADDTVVNGHREDLRLVDRFNRGDPSAFTELFTRHQKDVARLVVRMLGSSHDAQDVLQEVFLQVFRSLPEFRGNSRLSTWIYRVAVNVVLMYRRAGRSRPVLAGADLAPPPTDPEPLPDEQVELASRVAALERLMARLSEKKRTVFVLHELQGLSPVEIAEIVGAPVLTVRTRLFYARRELLSLIGRDELLAHLCAELEQEGYKLPANDTAAASTPSGSQTRGES